jgi:hypothetical protein
MHVRTILTCGSVTLALVAGLCGCGLDKNGALATLLAPTMAPSLGGATATSLVSVPFDPDNFAPSVTNPYLPLTPGTIFSFRTDGGVETNVVEVTRNKKSILGVQVTVVHDQVFTNGSLSEETFDWYAQDKQGNVWYFGEDTKEIENGVVVTTQGSWEAGVNGAKAGIIMLADPKIGDSYKQEDAPGVVADMGKVVSLKETVTVPYGTFSPCLETAEWTPLEPGDRSNKYYAKGIGVVLEVAHRSGGERVELVSVTTR